MSRAGDIKAGNKTQPFVDLQSYKDYVAESKKVIQNRPQKTAEELMPHKQS